MFIDSQKCLHLRLIPTVAIGNSIIFQQKKELSHIQELPIPRIQVTAYIQHGTQIHIRAFIDYKQVQV